MSSIISQTVKISIHALRGEGDPKIVRLPISFTFISIHALRGEGDNNLEHLITYQRHISIHALRGEGDHQE